MGRGKRMAWVVVCAVSASTAAAVEVPVSVSEPAGIARSNWPVCGGIPFRPGDVRGVADLVLVDAAGTVVPAQFTKLVGHDDGSVKWALVDLRADVAAKGTVTYTLKTGGRTAGPERPLRIEEKGDRITVDTGVITFTVNRAEFNLFDSVTVGGKKVVTGGGVELLNCELEKREVTKGRRTTVWYTMKPGGRTYPCRAGKPTRVVWEYKGPLRATLRVDGNYLGDGGPLLSYTTRITAWAGSGAVRVQHAIRNSNPEVGYDAFIKRATLSLNLAFEAAGQGHGLDWAAGSTGSSSSAGGDGAVGLLIQDRHTAGVYRGPGTYLTKDFGCGWSRGWKGLYGQAVQGRKAVVEIVSKGPVLTGRRSERGALGFTQGGTFALADRAHKESEVWFDFYTGTREPAVNEARARAFRSRLILVAPGTWYRDTEGLAIGHFGTLADEIATYKQWGWKGWDDEKKHPKLAHEPFAFVPKEWIHDVSEDDCPEGYLVQFLRTGERGFFDWASAWAGFYRGHAIYRTDWGSRWGVPAPKGARVANGLSFGWYGPHMYEWADSRMHECHHYGRGLFEYYLLTGEVDALEAGLDLAHQTTRRGDGFYSQWDRHKPGGSFGLGRSFGRKFLTVLSAWHATRDPQWKKVADHWAALVLKASNWDEQRGVYRAGMGIGGPYFTRDWTREDPRRRRPLPVRLEKYLIDNGITCKIVRARVTGFKGDQQWEIYKLPQLFELSACHLAFERYARFFNSEPMRKRVVAIARGVRDNYWSTHSRYMNGRSFLGWPEKGEAFDPFKWTDDPEHRKISGYATRYTADMFARAYSITRDPKWLVWAQTAWNRGSKRGYQATKPFAADDEVGFFAYIRGAHNNALTECSARMFYEAPRAQ